MSLHETVLQKYLDAQRIMADIEQVDSENVMISLPLHFSSNARVEMTVTRITENYFAISDRAQTIGELRDAGYGITGRLKKRMTEIGKPARIQFRGNHLVRECSEEELGQAIQEFADAAKTIGDAYLTYRSKKMEPPEDDLVLRDGCMNKPGVSKRVQIVASPVGGNAIRDIMRVKGEYQMTAESVLISAINNHIAVEVNYKNHIRQVWPIRYGWKNTEKKGQHKNLFCYQIGGYSSKPLKPLGSHENYRCWNVEDICSAVPIRAQWYSPVDWSTHASRCIDQVMAGPPA